MGTKPLYAPAFVNYDCQLCGWCCRQYDITLSPADYERLSKQEWVKLEPSLKGKELFAPLCDRSVRDCYRLRYTPEGACTFLSPENKCLMHAHVGELRKALGCSLFPFTFAQTPSGIYTGCRFSCKAVAGGMGEPVVCRTESLRRRFELCEKSHNIALYGDDVPFDQGVILPWSDYLSLEETLIRVLLRDDISLVDRLRLGFKLVEMLSSAQLNRVRGNRFKEFLDILGQGLLNEVLSEGSPRPPNALQRLLFRQFCFLFQQREGGAYRELRTMEKLASRLRTFRTGVKVAWGSGSVSFRDFPGSVLLEQIAQVKVETLGEAEEMALSRFLAAKLFGKQYFGSLFFNYPIKQGLYFLLLSAGAVMWYARARALLKGRSSPDAEDVIESIRYVDFSYGLSGAASLISERMRTRILAHGDAAPRVTIAQFT